MEVVKLYPILPVTSLNESSCIASCSCVVDESFFINSFLLVQVLEQLSGQSPVFSKGKHFDTFAANASVGERM